MTLLLAVELSQKRFASPTIASHALASELQREITLTQEQYDMSRAALEDLPKPREDAARYTEYGAQQKLDAARQEIERYRTKIAELARVAEQTNRELTKVASTLEQRAGDTQTIDLLRMEREELESELERLAASHRVIYSPGASDGQEIFLVELLSPDILVAPIGGKTVPETFSGPRANSAFLKWAHSKPVANVRFVVVVHPGSTEDFHALYTELNEDGYSIGFDLQPTDTRAIDPQNGAG